MHGHTHARERASDNMRTYTPDMPYVWVQPCHTGFTLSLMTNAFLHGLDSESRLAIERPHTPVHRS